MFGLIVSAASGSHETKFISIIHVCRSTLTEPDKLRYITESHATVQTV